MSDYKKYYDILIDVRKIIPYELRWLKNGIKMELDDFIMSEKIFKDVYMDCGERVTIWFDSHLILFDLFNCTPCTYTIVHIIEQYFVLNKLSYTIPKWFIQKYDIKL
jgi:hypothetical protein